MSRRLVLLLIVLPACASEARRIDVPKHYSETPVRAASPYVVKLSEGDRTWQIELPPVSTGYEVRVPIGDGTPLVPPSAAAGQADKSSPAYSEGLARVQALFVRKSYDLAMLEVQKLLAIYRDDTKLLAMQGTLAYKMGDKAAAQAAWERVARLDPENQAVLDMLEALP